MEYMGPDISEFNENVDFSKIKGKFDFVILRCGYGGDYEHQDDAEFMRSASECRRLGIPFGVYLYSYAKDIDGALSEARHTLRLIKGMELLYGVWYDVEDPVIPKALLPDLCTAYLDAIEKAGYYAGIYANLSWMEDYLSVPQLERFDKWVAQWNSTDDYEGNHGIWQFTSSYSIEGLSGRFDMNRSYRNYPEIIKGMGNSPSVQYKVIVTPSVGLNVRSGPGTGYDILSSVPYGTVLTVVKEEGGWGEVSGGGWVALQYTSKITAERVYTVTAPDGLNIRKGPGTGYDILRAVPLGTKLTAVGELNGWAALKDGGYATMEYLK